MIQWVCRQCGEDLEAPEALEGDHIECPECGVVSLVPPPGSDTGETGEGIPDSTGRVPRLVAVVAVVLALAATAGYGFHQRGERLDLMDTVAALEEQLAQLQRERDRARTEATTAGQQLDSLDQELTSLKGNLHRLGREKQTLNRDLREAEQESSSAWMSFERSRADADEATRDHLAAENEIAELQRDYDALYRTAEQIERERHMLARTVGRLQTENAQLEAELENARSASAATTTTCCVCGLWVEESIDSGEYIRLGDGSLWKLHPMHTMKAGLWSPGTDIILIRGPGGPYPYRLLNVSTDVVVHVERAR